MKLAGFPPSGSPRSMPGNADSPSSVSVGLFMPSQMMRKSCFRPGLPEAASVVNGHLDPRHAGVNRLDVDCPTDTAVLLAPAPSKGAGAAVGVVEEHRITKVAGALAHRRVDDAPIRRSASTSGKKRGLLRCTSRAELLRRPRPRTERSCPSGRRRRRCPACHALAGRLLMRGPDIARGASSPNEASTSNSFSFVRIGVSPTRRYPKDVLRMNLTNALTFSASSPRAPSFPVSRCRRKLCFCNTWF